MNPEIIQTQGWTLATCWNWDYQEAWDFQKKTVERVRETGEKWLIACSHPEVLTNGRGLQKAKKNQSFELQDFKVSAFPSLPIPFYQIERGGGLTFHHPGQLILYPIVKLHPQRLGLSSLVDNLLISTQSALEERGISDLDHKRDLLGLWKGSKKLASVGIAVDRMVTIHGLALNVEKFDSLKQKLAFLSPCGMGFETYTSVEEVTGRKLKPQDLMPEVTRRFFHAWE
ncbi:MAG: lipoyl(octanoyl) transferase LipB [Bacteriovoracaceae bacterium]|nr:lipoyl(octanoyl) transferase LipB [Bacteriovoracaceae bacterium]